VAELLVTGGAGFIGTNFVRYWRRNHPQDRVTVVDCLTYAGSRTSLEGISGVSLVVEDVCDTASMVHLIRQRGIDTIVHFAAESHVDRSITDPDVFLNTNVMGTHSLLKAARSVWLDSASPKKHRFHHVSTDEVYGSLEPGDPSFTETSLYAPNSPYSASKAAADHLVRAYHRTYGLQTTTSNCSNNYGPYQFPEKLIPLFFLNALHGLPLPVYGNGMNVRDWLHVEDHCAGIEKILSGGRPGETYNIGGGDELTNLEVVSKICCIVDRTFAERPYLKRRFPAAPPAGGRASETLKTFVPDRAGHDRRYAIDDRKIRQELGYKPNRTFTQGLSETLYWYLEHEEWWTPLKSYAQSQTTDATAMTSPRQMTA